MTRLKVGDVRKLNRHIRGWGLVQVVELDCTESKVKVDRVRDMETGDVYPACRRLLRPTRDKVPC